jgi:hypothetical protein
MFKANKMYCIAEQQISFEKELGITPSFYLQLGICPV